MSRILIFQLICYVILCQISHVFSIQCHVCDSFSGYCDFDGEICVAPKCSRRMAPTSNGLIREQRLCVPSDSPLGCHKAILWEDIEGTECVCDSPMCNQMRLNFSYFYVTLTVFLNFLF